MATPAGSGRGHVGVVSKSHLGAWSGFHATVGLVSVRWNHEATHAKACGGRWVVGVGVVACYEV